MKFVAMTANIYQAVSCVVDCRLIKTPDKNAVSVFVS